MACCHRIQVLSFFCIAALWLLPSSKSFAQVDPVAGFPPLTTQSATQYDSIDLASSHIMLTLPVRDKNGKVMSSFKFLENSHMWFHYDPGTMELYTTSPSFQLPRRNLGFGLGYTTTTITCNGQSDTIYSAFYVLDGSGTAHGLGPNIVVDSGQCYGLHAPATTTDGSGYTVVFTGTVPPPSSGVLSDVYDKSGNRQSTSVPGLIDPDGTMLANTTGGYIGSNWTFSSFDSIDPAAPVLSTTYPSQSNVGLPYTTTYTDAGNNAVTFTTNYSPYTSAVNFNCPPTGGLQWPGLNGATTGVGTPVYLPSSITTPDGVYSFTYEQTPNWTSTKYPPPYVTGRIASITLPSGSSISYSYSGGSNGLNCNSGVVPTLTRTVYDSYSRTTSTWKYVNNDNINPYSRVPYVPINFTVTETTPSGDTITHYFNGELETQRIVQDVNLGVIGTTVTCYNKVFTSCAIPTQDLAGGAAAQTDVYTYPGNTSTSPSLVETVRDSNGNVTAVNKYDAGATTPPTGTPLSSTVTTYNSGSSCGALTSPYILDHPCSITTYTSGVQTSQTTYTYNGTGHPTQTNKWISGTNYNTTLTSYNANGTVNVVTDVNGTTYTYGYSGVCNGLVPTSLSISGTGGSLSRSMSYDCNGGVETSITDENGQKVTFDYTANGADPFYRVKGTIDQIENETFYNYQPNSQSSPGMAEASLSFNNGQSIVDRRTYMDGLGHPLVDQTLQGPGSSTLDTVSYTYDLNGRPYSTSTPCTGTFATLCATTPATTQTYDALNRPLLKTDGGGGTVQYVYTGRDVLRTTGPSQNFKTQFEYDGIGRLTSVCEITSAAGSGACGQSSPATGYLTKYTYSPNLLTVTQNWQPGAIGGQQTRAYAYDGLGRLISELNPETGTTQYFYDTAPSSPGVACPVSTFEGDLVKKYDAQGNTICSQYDYLHRLTAVMYSGPDSTRTPQKHFVYDTTSLGTYTLTMTKGRLSEAYTGPSTAKITDLGFSYTARGEVSDVYESTPHSGGYYHVNATYYAHCAVNAISGLPSMPTISYGAGGAGLDGEGRVTQVTASSGTNPIYQSGVTYTTTGGSQPVGTITKVIYGSTGGSGDFDTFGYDMKTGRMTSFTFSVGSTPQTLAGSLTWNMNGTLGSMAITDQMNSSNSQTCNYGYDDLARITSANCPSVWSQTFTFDAFGNASKSGSSAFLPTYSSSTNQYSTVPSCAPGPPTGPAYNLNGDPTNDCEHVYTWNADNNPVSVDTSNTFTYDALGRMVETVYSSGNTEFVYAPTGERLALMNGQSIQKATFGLPGGGAAIYKLSGGTPTLIYFRHGDWLASGRLASTPSRAMYYDVAYAPYGEAYSGKAGTGGMSTVAFTGEGKDTTTDLYPFMFRQYNSVQSRWVWPDPAGLQAVNMENPQSWNRYAYVLNNPLVNTDPNGLDCIYLTDSGNATESIDHDSNLDECNGAGGYWIPGFVANSNWVTTIDSNIGAVGAYSLLNGNLVFTASTNNQYGHDITTVGVDVPTTPADTAVVAANKSGWSLFGWDKNAWKTFFTEAVQPWKDTCAQTFARAFGEGGIVSAVNPNLDGGPGTEPDSLIKQVGTIAAAQYAVNRGLVVPLRSSIYRGILEGTETAATGFVLLDTYTRIGQGVYEEGKSYLAGECR